MIRILSRLRLLSYLNIRVNVNINSKKFKVPVLKGMGFGNIYMAELWMIEVLKIIYKIKQGGFIDIGVNIGQSLLKLRAVNNDADYIGFEPNPCCVNYVEELIVCNKFLNTEIVPVGISNKTEVLKLNFYEESSSDSSASLNENFRPGKKIFFRKTVQVVNYEIIEKAIPEKVGIVKIDVEGFELYVIQGIEKLIIQKRPVILLEILPVYEESLKERLASQQLIESFFKLNDYRMLRIIKNASNGFDHFETIESIGIHSDINLCDYVFVPVELEKAFK